MNNHNYIYDDFENNELQKDFWFDFYLPQWSSRKRTRPSYEISESRLRLLIGLEQTPWSQEWNDSIRVSNIQSGVFSGEIGSRFGQHRFRDDLVVREHQELELKVAPFYGEIEFRSKCNLKPHNLAGFWMIGIETKPYESTEICIFELMGFNVMENSAVIGYGVKAFGDKTLKDEFYEDEFDININEYNVYGIIWNEEKIEFSINGNTIRTIYEVPKYRMQLMINLYDLEYKDNDGVYFDIDYVKVKSI